MTAAVVTVIIPTFNNRALIELCLRSMRCCTLGSFCVVVKDNGSTDGTVEFLENSGLSDRVLKSQTNDRDHVEFRAYDDVIRNHVNTPYFLVCHSDIIFLEADWMDDLTKSAGADDGNIMGGRIFPSSYTGRWIFGRWLSPWYAWGRTEPFKELGLTWQRKFPAWCAHHFAEVRAYFDEELTTKHPDAQLFWEHGGYLLWLIEQHGRHVVNYGPTNVFHIGDMTGSILKGIHHPNEPETARRVARATAIEGFIKEMLAHPYGTGEEFLSACRKVAEFALQHDRAILREFRS